ncbi:hypothetical protein [Prevotella sp.]|uniref:hypothetical protein n=1 Tax=Prevotella sp. TaxID=59823 RepID=UPI001CAF07E2|nr:hypothetical protein [Prevotella sp.]MBF1627983.1 hypothetical protein [Prevotella sp.]
MEKKKEKKNYHAPECKVHSIQVENFICTSVTPSASGSTSPSWGSEQEHGGGTILIGGSSVAPAKQAPSWGEEEEAD